MGNQGQGRSERVSQVAQEGPSGRRIYVGGSLDGLDGGDSLANLHLVADLGELESEQESDQYLEFWGMFRRHLPIYEQPHAHGCAAAVPWRMLQLNPLTPLHLRRMGMGCISQPREACRAPGGATLQGLCAHLDVDNVTEGALGVVGDADGGNVA